MRAFYQDVRYGFRAMLKNPGFTSVAVLALALGIGANTTIFTVVRAVLLEALPYPEPDRLVTLLSSAPKAGYAKLLVAAADYFDWRTSNQVFEDVALARFVGNFNISSDGEPERVQGGAVTASLFRVLRTAPELGRVFTAEEDQPAPGAAPKRVVVLSHGLWQRRFGGDPTIVGRAIRLNGEPHTVLGVMPPAFRFPSEETELWAPIEIRAEEIQQRLGHDYLAIARLKRGVSQAQAQAEMQGMARRLAQQFPMTGLDALVFPLGDELVAPVRKPLLVLLGAVGFVLLIACANVANLLLARATARRKELTVRAALGAGRSRLIRQLLLEGVPLLLVGTLAGLLLAFWGVDLLRAVLPASMPRAGGIAINGPVLAFTIGLSLLTGILFGLAPAIQATRTDLMEALRISTSQRSAVWGRWSLSRGLIVVEVALALVLLTGAGLLLRSFERLRLVDAGIRSDHVLTMQFAFTSARYAQPHQQAEFCRQLIERVEKLPGVEAAGMVNRLPLSNIGQTGPISFEGVNLPVQDLPSVDWRSATPGYFRALGIPLLRGREFRVGDGPDAPVVGVIDEEIAQRIWPNQDPIGKRFRLGSAEQNTVRPQAWTVIVGVARHIRNDGLDTTGRPQVYWNYLQRPQSRMTLVLRTRGEPLTMVNTVREQVRAIDADQPAYDVRSMEQVVARSVSQRWFNTALLGVFASLALALAAIGIYGVISYSVSQRTQEIGIRMAIGAQQSDVLKLVVGQGLALSLGGVAAGLIASLALTRVLRGLLYNVSPADPVTYAATALVLLLAAALASYLPARRATKVEPIAALRYE